MNVAVCQPPYANITGVIAAANRISKPPPSTIGCNVSCERPKKKRPAPRSMAMASSFKSIRTVCVFDPLRTPRTIDQRQHREGRRGDDPFRQMQSGQFDRVAREGDRHRRHPAALHDEQQRPAVHERRGRVIRIGSRYAYCPPASGRMAVSSA